MTISRPYLFESLVGDGFDLGSFVSFVGFLLVIGIWLWSAIPSIRNLGGFFGMFQEEEKSSSVEFVTRTRTVDDSAISNFPVQMNEQAEPTNYAIVSDGGSVQITNIIDNSSVAVHATLTPTQIAIMSNIDELVKATNIGFLEVTSTPTHFYRVTTTPTPTPTVSNYSSNSGSNYVLPTNQLITDINDPRFEATKTQMVIDNLEAMKTAFP